MADAFAGHQPTLTGPADRHYAVSPGSSVLDPRPRALFVGSAGNVTIEDAGGVSVQYAVEAGTVLPIRATKVTAATATGIVAWY